MINENGKGIIQWSAGYGKQEQWQLIYADGPKKGQPYEFFQPVR
jgi:hypothetical protein